MKSSRSTRPDGLLRGDAEAELKHTPRAEVPARSADELLHELQVHQIELEIQNEALREAQVALEESRDRYVDLYEFAPVAYLTLAATGQIEAINLTGAALLGIKRESFQHNRFARFVASEDRDRWQRHFLHTLRQGGKSNCELGIQRGDGTVFDASVDCLLTAESGSAPTLRITLSDITGRKLAEAKLIESEARLQTLIQTLPDLIWLKDSEGVYLACNHRFELFFGASEKDIAGKTDHDFVDRELADFFLNHDRIAMAKRGPSVNEEWITFADGHRELLETTKTPMFDTGGRLIGVIGIGHDITARKRAEEALRKLSQAVEQSPVSIVITDLEGNIEYVNPAFSNASGYSAAEALGQNPRLLKSGRTPPETYDDLWATLVAGKVWRGEFINRRKDGSEYYEAATLSPVCQVDGRVTHFVGVKINISELKQTMEKLRLSEERLRLAKTAAGLGIFDWDLANGKGEWDERARELRGVGPDEPITLATIIEGIPPDDRAAVQAAFDRAFDPLGAGEYHAEYRVISHVDGGERQIAANGQAFFEGGHAVRLVGTVQDVTEQKRLEGELQARRGAMEVLIHQQVAAQTAAAIAHELNQPLIAVSAYSEAALRILRTGAKSPEKLSRAIEGAVEQAQRAGQTLHELLDFLHRGEAPTEPVELEAIVRDALAFAEENGCSGFRHLIGVERDLPPVQANRLQLQKVLVNLFHNGVESMRDAGVPEAAITIKVRTMIGRNTKGEKMIQVTVQDNGTGLDVETAHRIFAPFFTTKPDGVGLGLTISRAFIEAHGGQLWADIKAGPGATFHFVLPIA